MRALLVVAVAACRAPVPVAAPPVAAPIAVSPPAVDAMPAGATIAGRVLLDGKPVPVFGVSIVRSFQVVLHTIEIQDADGRFRLPAKPGRWDLVISGPDFARRVLVGNTVGDEGTLELGDIVVEHGHTIEGVVRDDKGLAVAGARVVLSTLGFDGFGNVHVNEATGTHVVRTDASGHYRIDGVVAFPPGQNQIVTKLAPRASVPTAVPDGDATIDLQIAATGELDIAIPQLPDSIISVQSVQDPRITLFGDGMPGGRRFRDLPVGDYEVRVRIPIRPRWLNVQRATVAAGAIAKVPIAVPVLTPVTVELHVGDLACDELTLSLIADRSPLTTVACARPDTQIAAVIPGDYSACAHVSGSHRGACTMISVDEKPAVQRFELRRR